MRKHEHFTVKTELRETITKRLGNLKWVINFRSDVHRGGDLTTFVIEFEIPDFQAGYQIANEVNEIALQHSLLNLIKDPAGKNPIRP